MEKKNIKKYAGVGVLSMALTAGAVGIAIGCYESSVDHLNEYCPLNYYLGVEHQIEEIHQGNSYYGVTAFPVENGRIQLVSNPEVVMDSSSGNTYFYAPPGYTLEGENAVKTVNIASGTNGIAITKEGIYNEPQIQYIIEEQGRTR